MGWMQQTLARQVPVTEQMSRRSPEVPEIRKSINKGLALGSDRFVMQIEALTEKRVSSRKAGRPKKDFGNKE